MFEFDFDFDESSKIWRKNKIYMGNGCYNYRCCFIYKNKKNCNKPINSNTNFENNIYCEKHKIK